MKTITRVLAVLVFAGLAMLQSVTALAQPAFITFESGQVRPLAISPDGSQLFVVNTPDSQLEIFDITGSGLLVRAGVVQVGMEPVAVAARSNDEVWVVNFLSDSVSVIDLSGIAPRVVRTLLVGDEPSDIVFAGSAGNRAFITAAHRGQNSPYPQGEYATPGIGRADVWVFDANALGTSLGGDAETIITLFGDKPRALAATADGATVYAAVFHSGNRTMELHEGHVCDTSNGNMSSDSLEGSCGIGAETSPGGYPTPHQDHNGADRPETGLIVQLDRDGGTSNQWQDEHGRNWNDMVKFNLPDRDVFEIDADAPVPVAIDGSSSCANGGGCWSDVGTVLFNMAINPVSGKIYVSNTDSQNHVRFEGPGSHATLEQTHRLLAPSRTRRHCG
jgi:DNA-binding beta-propeller fold protein YncE